MNKYQKWLVVSIVFLAAAFIMPIYALSTALSATIIAVNTIPQNTATNEHSTGSGITSFIATQQAAQLQLTIIVVAVEALLVAVFAVTFWYAIKCRDQCRTYPPP
jgi:hypothetical protein